MSDEKPSKVNCPHCHQGEIALAWPVDLHYLVLGVHPESGRVIVDYHWAETEFTHPGVYMSLQGQVPFFADSLRVKSKHDKPPKFYCLDCGHAWDVPEWMQLGGINEPKGIE
jgi:hypothetical protein